MDMLANLFSTIWAIHVNGWITLWNFLTENLFTFVVMAIMTYMMFKELGFHEHQFMQDKRKIL